MGLPQVLERIARACHRQVFGPDAALHAQRIDLGPNTRQLRAHKTHQTLVHAQPQ